jgi:hypothetical protein
MDWPSYRRIPPQADMSEDQVIKDVLLAAQPTKEFVTVEQIASLALFLCSEDAALCVPKT